MIPFVLGAIVVVLLVVGIVRAERRRREKRHRDFTALGFTPCDEEAGALAKRVAELYANPRYEYAVKTPMRAALPAGAAYFVLTQRTRTDDVLTAEEFLIPLRRPSPGNVLLVVKPSRLAHGAASRLMGAVATGPWDSLPDGLDKMELPPDLRGTNIVAALGAPGAALYDLVTPGQLAVIAQVGDAGALFALCRGDWCSLASTHARMPLKPAQLWALARELSAA